MKKKVDYIIIGAQKAGTTSLHDLLVQHQKVSTSLLKENTFFSRDSEYQKGLKYFKKLFPKNIPSENVLGTSDVQLLSSEKGVKRVYEYNPSVKIIVLLRNPVDRAYSAYNFAIQQERETDEISFEQRFIEFSQKDLNNYKRDETALFDYFYDSFYGLHLNRWASVFSKENIFVCTTNELRQTPQLLLNRIFGFLGIPKSEINEIKKSNVTGKQRFGKLQKIFFNGDNKYITKLGSLFGVKTRLWIRKHIIQKFLEKTFIEVELPKLDTELRDEITNIYKTDLNILESDYNISFDMNKHH